VRLNGLIVVGCKRFIRTGTWAALDEGFHAAGPLKRHDHQWRLHIYPSDLEAEPRLHPAEDVVRRAYRPNGGG
jgi:hypothetical protein